MKIVSRRLPRKMWLQLAHRVGRSSQSDARPRGQVSQCFEHKNSDTPDTGALTINGESPEAVLECSSRFIGHVHASEPNLVPLGDGGTDHQLMHKALSQHLPEHLVSIEMVATKEEPHLQSIERALVCAAECYRTKHRVAR